MKKYTKRRKTKRNKPFRKTVRGGGPRNKFTEHYDDDAIFLFNEMIDIFGDPLDKGPTKPGHPIYGKYTIREWIQKSRSEREKELAEANKTPTGSSADKRVRGRIEPLVEYINNKNRNAYKEKLPYPFVLSIPAFAYEDENNKQDVEEELVPDPDPAKKDSFAPILPDDFLRFTRRSDVLNVLFPFFMKVYISLQKELNEDVGETNTEENKQNEERMDYVLYILREIHSFASPIWFSPIYSIFYKMGLSKSLKQAKMGYDAYIAKLNEALAKTKETPVETTMYSFPSFVSCNDANCEPDIIKPIHSVFIRNSEFDEKAPIDSYLNMIFYGKDRDTTALSELKGQIKKDPLYPGKT